MRKLVIIVLFVTFPAFSQTFTTPIGSATDATLTEAKVEQFIRASVMAMNRPGGMERYARNTLKAALGRENLPSGTESQSINATVYRRIFSPLIEDRSLWLRTVVDPVVWDITHERMGPVDPDAYPACVVAASAVVKNPVNREQFIQKADYESRTQSASTDLKQEW